MLGPIFFDIQMSDLFYLIETWVTANYADDKLCTLLVEQLLKQCILFKNVQIQVFNSFMISV